MSNQKVTLSVPALKKAVSELEDIKGKITALGGTISQRLAAAKSEALASGAVKTPVLQVKASDSLDVAEAAIEEWKSAVAQRLDEAVTAIMRGKKDATDKDLTALREAFAAKRETAVAMATMLVSIGADGASDVQIPTLKGTGKVGGGSKGATTGNQAFWTRKSGGEKIFQPDSQNKYSSLAWYHGVKVGAEADANKGKGSSAKALDTLLGGRPSATTAWEYTNKETGFSIGMDVKVQPEGDAE